MKSFFFIIFAFIYYQCFGQGNIVSINTTVPAQFTICAAPKVFTISVYNPSPFLLSNDTLKLVMPSGVAYQIGSVTGATEFNTTQPNKPIFLLSNIPTLSTVNITFSATVGCDIIQYTGGGGTIENKIRVDYTANNIHNYDTYTSPYTVRQPNLFITTVTNQSYSGSVADVFTRCITITNSGLGELSQFTFTDIHGSGIQVNTINTGVWVNTGTTETVTFNATQFNSIGNNNGLFEQGESITVCETLKIVNCSAISSNFAASWGCNGQVCQSAISSANVVFPNLIPELQITSINVPMNFCPGAGNPSPQKLLITNIGLGQATTIHLDIFQTNGNGYNNNMGSNIDENSFTLQIGSAAPIAIVPDSAQTTNQLSCMAANAKGRVFITLPSISPGDTVYIRFNTYSCCYNACTGIGESNFNGWAYKGSYSNVCHSPYLVYEAWGRVYSQLFGNLINNNSPSYLDSGQIGTFNFKFSSYLYQQPYPGNSSAYWKFVFTLPPCLVYSGNFNIISGNGSSTWAPTSVTVSGNTVTGIFNGQPPFTLDQADVVANLAVDCNGCSGAAGSVDIQAFYVPGTSCGCEVGISCQNAPVTVLCTNNIGFPSEPGVITCPQGMMFRYYYFKRTSYGKPDNESSGGNGLADNSGVLDFSKIKTNRAMFGDTITTSYNGKVRTSPAHPIWQYCYSSSSFSNGNLLSFLDAQLLVYRGGSLLATCTSVTPAINTSGTTRKFKYNLSVAGLISQGCLPSGFTYLNGDSVIFKPRYKVTLNTTGPILKCVDTAEYYLSDIPNPVSAADKYSCDGYMGVCFIMGYCFVSYDDSYYMVKSCDNFIASQSYGLSIGPCCNNYDGGNLFPFEYRNWAHIKILKTIVPHGYHYLSAQFVENRTAGNGVSAIGPTIALTPLNPNSDTLTFPVEQYFMGFGGSIPLSDDGFSGTLKVTLEPSCQVVPVLSQGIRNDWTFAPTGYLTGSGSFPTFISVTQDYVIYEAPALLLQAVLPSVTAPDNTATWEVSISNSSNVSNASNTWLSAPTISGVTINQVFDLDSNVIIAPTGSFYKIGIVTATKVRKLRIDASFISCNQDSIILYSGWNCTGYPDSLSAYPCIPQKITLKETPLFPVLDLNITAPSGSVPLCDTSTITVDGLNFQLGTLYNVLLSATLPVGLTIVPGSSKLKYPLNSSYAPISNPTLIGGTLWQWNLSAINNLIGLNGLRSVLDTNLNEFKIIFKVVTNCGYTSGSIIHFKLNGNAACGFPIQKETSSHQLFITGATMPYSTAVSLRTSYLSPCAANSVMHVSFINHGPLASGASDSIAVILPPGVSYVNGSFSGIHNAPVSPNPNQLVFNNQIMLMWKIPASLIQGDSSVFTFNYAGSAANLSCGIVYFLANTLSTANVVCTSSGNACNINVLTGQDTLPVFIYKANLSLSNPHGYSVPNPPAGETATINFTINNSGQDVFPANSTVISYYYDSNGNGIYNTGDVFIANDTQHVSIPSNGTYPYSTSIHIPSGYSCSIIALLDTALSHCSCAPSQLSLNLPLKNIGIDTFSCSGQAISLGFQPITGYTYSWTPSTGLSNPASSSPVFTGSNTTGAPVASPFIVTTNRIHCASKDTIIVTVYPNPTFSITGTDSICYGANNGRAMVTALSGGTPPYSYLWNTTPVQINDTAINLPAGIYYDTVTDSRGCSSAQHFTVYQPNTGLSASITSSSNITCNSLCNGSATVTASGGTGNYSFLWNTTPAQTTANINGLCAGNYSVIIGDGNTSGCSAFASLVVHEPPLLTASVAVLNSNCNVGNNATATVTTSGGTPGYTYQWSNGQTTATATGLSPGTYTITVTDSNSCIQTANAIVTAPVHVTAIPDATDICIGHSTIINAVVTGGAPNYSFLWNTVQTSQSISVAPLANTSYTVSVTDNNGCTDSSVIQLQVHPNPVVNFTATKKAGCEPLCLAFTDSSFISGGNNTQWLWDVGDGSAVSTSQTFDHCYFNDSVYSQVSFAVTLTVTSDNGCATTISKSNYITVYPNPKALFAVQPLIATIIDPVISIVDLSTGATAWQWNFGDIAISSVANPLPHTYKDTGTYIIRLITSNNYGCYDTAYQTVIIDSEFEFYIPNSFTPDGDGKNDVFTGKGVFIKEYEMKIFDRWGNLIFYTDDLNKAWDGKANHGTDIAQRDVYVYIVKITDIKNQKHSYRGIVTLIR